MIEIQIHPSDIRRNVRYLFFGRRPVIAGILIGIVLLAIVVCSMAAAPSVIRQLYLASHIRSMEQEREIQIQRLRHHVDRMAAIEHSIDDQRLRVEKLVTIYGLHDEEAGKGGVLQSPGVLPGDETGEVLEAKRKELDIRRSIERVMGQLDMLDQFETQNSELVKKIPSILPVPADEFVLTSPFGTRISPFTRQPDYHRGLDLAARRGTPVSATADGVVTFAGRYPMSRSVSWWRFGNVVVLNHADRFITVYAHLDATSVSAGQAVRQGQVIGTVGSTGWSTNAHLHYEVRSDLEVPGEYRPIDPRIYILNYRWSDEETLLIRSRSSGEFEDLDPLPSAFIGRRRSV